MSPRKTFFAIALCLLAGLAGYFTWLSQRQAEAIQLSGTQPAPAPASPLPPAPVSHDGHPASPPAPAPAPPPAPFRLLFRHNAVDAHYGQLAYLDSPDQAQRQFVSHLSCEAVHFAKDRGICLTADRGVFTTYAAVIFDRDFRKLFTIPLHGSPSRCRMSANGRVAAATVFVTGHSYASTDFTTQTLLFDTHTGRTIADLENFQITRGGQAMAAADFNFWGVTFAPDSRHFYCTLSSNRKHYLVHADLEARSGQVIRENVECPSVSPSGLRVAFKKRLPVPERVKWQIHLLDLRTNTETTLPEFRSVDDQIEWLDEQTVLYALSAEGRENSGITNVWRIDTASGGPPRRYLTEAYSPAAAR